MGALDCVSGDKIKSTDSTEVFTINMATSNSYLDVPVSLFENSTLIDCN